MKGKLLFSIFIVYLICSLTYFSAEGIDSVDDMKAATWFAMSFQGEWKQLPIEEKIPTMWILEDSKEWADIFLADNFNPYKDAEIIEQRMFLGLGTSPDKLVTTYKNKNTEELLTIYETLQDFIITNETINSMVINDSNQALLQIQSKFLPILSEQAKNLVNEIINTSLEQRNVVELNGSSPLILSHSSVPINAIRKWSDRIYLIWFEGKLYINCYKTHPGTDVISFIPGLDWYPQELRDKYNANRE